MRSAKVHKWLRYVLALGTLAYGIASLARTKRFAELTNMGEDEVQSLAMRDIGSGLALLTASNPTPLLIGRAMNDFRDGAKLLRTRPNLAPVAFAWGLLAVAVLLTRPRSQDAGTQDE